MSGRHLLRRGRHGRRALVLIMLGLALVVLVPPSAPADTPQDHGYWWRIQSGATNLAPPPAVPRRGLWVSNDGAGQHAVSAVRFRAGLGVEIESLELTVSGETGQTPILLACPARGPWKSIEAGAWSDRPASACDVAFSRGDRRGGAIRFDVRGLAREGELDVVILAPADVGTAFSVSFDQPGAQSIVTRSPGSPSPSAQPSSGSPRPRPTSAGSVVGTRAPTPSPTTSPSASATQGQASSPLGDAVRDLATDDDSTGGGNAFLWLLAVVAVVGAIVGWRVRSSRPRRQQPSASV